MLARYTMERGKPARELPSGVRQDTRRHTRHFLRPTRELVTTFAIRPTQRGRGLKQNISSYWKAGFERTRQVLWSLLLLQERTTSILGAAAQPKRTQMSTIATPFWRFVSCRRSLRTSKCCFREDRTGRSFGASALFILTNLPLEFDPLGTISRDVSNNVAKIEHE